MAYLSIDPVLLQRVRLEIAASDGAAAFTNLAYVGVERLRVHVERLFYGGEIAGSARVKDGGLLLDVDGLTPYGVLAMHAEIARNASLRRDA